MQGPASATFGILSLRLDERGSCSSGGAAYGVCFELGSVYPGARARFRVFGTDPSPVEAFYLPQELRLLMAGAPRRAASVAGS